MHWTKEETDARVYYRVDFDDTEAEVLPAGNAWELCYTTSEDLDWTVGDLGRFNNEAELPTAADQKLAELLGRPELAGERTCCDGDQDS